MGKYLVTALSALVFGAIGALVPFAALAAPQIPAQTEFSPQLEPASDRLFFLASVSRGGSQLASSVAGADTSGSRTELLLLASYDLDFMTIEGGGGWMRDIQRGSLDPVGFGLESYELTTDAAVIEVSPQFRIARRLRVGPLLEAVMGEDVSFTPRVTDSTRSLVWLSGLQAHYEFTLGGTSLRAGARYLSSMGIPGQDVESLQATLQFGLPVM